MADRLIRVTTALAVATVAADAAVISYNHYSLLRTVEDIFGLPHLGDAAMPRVKPFGPDVFATSRPRASLDSHASMSCPVAKCATIV